MNFGKPYLQKPFTFLKIARCVLCSTKRCLLHKTSCPDGAKNLEFCKSQGMLIAAKNYFRRTQPLPITGEVAPPKSVLEIAALQGTSKN